jgi:hypothetical protein
MPPARTWLWASALSALAAFLIYACGALMLHPAQEHTFNPERSPLAAAVSNVVHGAPFGKVYSGALDIALSSIRSTEQILAQASRPEVGRSKLLPNTENGMGMGYLLVADVGFRLFGVHVVSLVYTMLALMAISAAAFWFRFPDERFVVVPVYFSALTVMLVTPLVWEPDYSLGIPIGGFRYFSLVAILPAFHLLFELWDRRPLAWRWKDLLATAAQSIVFLTAVLVRNNAATLIGAIVVGGMIFAWTLRRDRVATRTVAKKAGLMALVGAAFAGILMMSLSREYLSHGRFTETVWTRVVVSLGMHPDWPYGNLREIYDCRENIPSGLVPGTEDQNGHCLWHVYAKKHNLPADTAFVGGTYSRDYDAALRHEFFNILRAYPREVFETFAFIKVWRIYWALGRIFEVDLARVPVAVIALAATALANLFLLSLFASLPSTATARATALFAASTLPAYIVAWAYVQTSADLACLLLIGLGLAVMAILTGARRVVAPAS